MRQDTQTNGYDCWRSRTANSHRHCHQVAELVTSAVLINFEQAPSALSFQLALTWLIPLQCSSTTGACVHSVDLSAVHTS